MGKEAMIYRYLGDGSEFHTGIPARNLTPFDVAQLDKERQLVLSASPLYEKVETANDSRNEDVVGTQQKVERKGKAGK